jgi:hypothetical protein
MFSVSDAARSRWSTALLVAALVMTTSSAAAQPAGAQSSEAQPRTEGPPHTGEVEPSTEEVETARSLVGLGHQRLKEGDDEAALQAFVKADAIMGVPTTGLLVGKTEAKLGMLLEARDTLLRVARFPSEPGEPAPFAEARREAKQRAGDIIARIPTLRVLITTRSGPLPSNVVVKVVIDGASFTATTAALPRNVNPGEHELSCEAPGYVRTSTRVTLSEGDRLEVTLALRPAPRNNIPSVLPDDDGGSDGVGGSSTALVVAYAGFGTGGAGLIVGAITGALSLSAASDAKGICPQLTGCPEAARAPHDRAIDLANASNTGFAVAGAGLAVGAIALIVHLVSDDDEPQHGLGLAPAVRPTLMGAALQF